MSDVIYGIHAVTAALKQGRKLGELMVADGHRPNARVAALLNKARERGVSIRRVATDELDQLSQGGRHQGVVARLQESAPSVAPAQDIVSLVQSLNKPALLLILDGVTDPHNLGACLRSADAAGVDAVIVPKDKAVGLTPVVRKVACGAAESVPFYRVTNLARTLRELQELGVWLVGTAGEAQTTLYEADLSGSLAIVMGAEEKGLRRLTREHCDTLIKIPMAGTVESLNVSVATGITLFEAVRQRTYT